MMMRRGETPKTCLFLFEKNAIQLRGFAKLLWGGRDSLLLLLLLLLLMLLLVVFLYIIYAM